MTTHYRTPGERPSEPEKSEPKPPRVWPWSTWRTKTKVARLTLVLVTLTLAIEAIGAALGCWSWAALNYTGAALTVVTMAGTIFAAVWFISGELRP